MTTEQAIKILAKQHANIMMREQIRPLSSQMTDKANALEIAIDALMKIKGEEK